ncbi:MAG: RimK family protein [Deltaproteobacteria bacterium]|jgi:glutathione synthase/RimK-type ligase-like ATP-grasp enzyme|nr:RimK family protein [Deltaproteobacteria bacterium]MBW2476355.1 RimK family protein [Deltaproteobacteria bacterium]MBW2505430.1 RimK family protein [Deltaproteobacteria bacterium]MBW2520287.1 RimK family protein [Deltaproteobacteria bacterium]
MPSLIVVDNPCDWPHAIADAEVVEARQYLTDSSYVNRKNLKVFNLCRSYRYQSIGYYVSLLAAARGHRPQPGVQTIQDLKSSVIIRSISDELDRLIQKSLQPLQSKDFILSIYFGRNLAKRYDRLSRKLYSLFQAPLMRAHFTWSIRQKKWLLQSIGPVAVSGVPAEHVDFLLQAAKTYFSGRQTWPKTLSRPRYDMAILVDPDEIEPPSDERALQRFEKAAIKVGFAPVRIGRDDYGRLAEFDALFIRETTSVNHHTYRFARRAAAEGLVVVDDPESILRCTNKVFLAEILERHKVLTPQTLIVDRSNRKQLTDHLEFPIVLKQPDSSFSQGVTKVDNVMQLKEQLERLFAKSELIIAQEFLPTPFDWRVGIFDCQPLYACRYFMAKHHWQILKRDGGGKKAGEGRFETLPVEHLPAKVLRVALKAANLIGRGFYGVDLKQVGPKVYVIEVNDNPSIDAGVEDKCLKLELYDRFMKVMFQRVVQQRGRA